MNLPDLCVFQGNWHHYVEELYQVYLDEIAHGDLIFKGLPVRTQFRPYTDGKGYGFWHIISNGPVEEDRLPDMRRCERIRWIQWIIQNVGGTDQRITWWENKRGRSKHVVLWIEEEDFAVILAKRSRYFLLRTAYMVKSNRRRIFIKEREEFWKA